MFRANCNWKTVIDVLGGKHIKKLTIYETLGGDEADIYDHKFTIRDCMIDNSYKRVGFSYIDERKGSCLDLYNGCEFSAYRYTPEISKPELTVEAFCRISPRKYFVCYRVRKSTYMAMVIQLKDKI